MRRAEAETPIERQHAFDSIFPPQKIRDFEEGGDSDWIGLFDALKAFNHGFTPEGEEPVLKMILSHQSSSALITRQTEAGLMVYRRNVTPLLNTIFNLGIEPMQYWSEATKEKINGARREAADVAVEAMRIAKANRDWEK